mgnify:CR=1 FL=1
MGKSLPGFLWWDSAGLAVFDRADTIGAAGGASRLPYGKLGSVRCFGGVCGGGDVGGVYSAII